MGDATTSHTSFAGHSRNTNRAEAFSDKLKSYDDLPFTEGYGKNTNPGWTEISLYKQIHTDRERTKSHDDYIKRLVEELQKRGHECRCYVDSVLCKPRVMRTVRDMPPTQLYEVRCPNASLILIFLLTATKISQVPPRRANRISLQTSRDERDQMPTPCHTLDYYVS